MTEERCLTIELEEEEALAKNFAFVDAKISQMDLQPKDVRNALILSHTAKEKIFLTALLTATWQRYMSAALKSLTADK